MSVRVADESCMFVPYNFAVNENMVEAWVLKPRAVGQRDRQRLLHGYTLDSDPTH